MAVKFISLIMNSIFSFFFFSSITHLVLASRSLSTHPETAVFDVSASIQKSIDVLNFNPRQSRPNEHPYAQSYNVPPSSSFTVPLFSGSAVEPNAYKTYTDLTISRLERDSARVKWLLSKLDSKLNKRSPNKLVVPAFDTEKIQAPVTSGASQGVGNYFSRVGVGSPVKPTYLTIDTGSDITWLQCEPCTRCYSQTDPIFDPSASSTYAPLTCQAQACQLLSDSSCTSANTCWYETSYGDESFTKGDFATETVTFGSSGSVPNFSIGCGRNNGGKFAGSAGLLGLGGGAVSLPSQIKATSFSYCLVDRDSSSASTLEFNSPRPADSITTPIIQNDMIDTYYYVGLTGLSVGGTMLSIPQSLFEIDGSGDGGVIVDSGTTITHLPTEAYNILRDSFKTKAQNLPTAPSFYSFDTCYDFSGTTSVFVPTVSFHFAGGKELKLQPNNYLVRVDGTGTHCFAFQGWSLSISIIGNIQQQGMRVSYDLANSIVGFSPGKC